MNKILINKDLCKKCNICVEFCPRKVFVINKEGYIIPKYTDKCIGCKLCVIRCPEFALKLEANNI